MTTSRRTILKYSAGVAALGLLGRPARAAPANPIRIGVIYDLSGPFAAAGSMAYAVPKCASNSHVAKPNASGS